MLRQFSLLLFFVLFFGQINAQQWLDESILNKENPNFFEMRDAFETYWKDKKIEKGKGFKPFKRWEWFWETRVGQDGSFPDRSIIWEESKRKPSQSANRNMPPANWTSLGPNSSGGGYGGVGRINCVAFHPTDANTFWVGSPGGGLWKTTNGGTSWTSNTDDLPVLGVSSIVIHPTDPNIMYLGTGDGDGWDTYSVGVLKSTDGGATWNTTGLNWTNQFNRVIRKLIMDPDDVNHLMAATSDGIWRTTNAGANWSQVATATGNFVDIEANPSASTSIFYASKDDKIYRSTNNGATWTLSQTIAGAGRIALGVSAASSTTVIALASDGSTNGFLGLYRSTDSGVSFSEQSSSPNLLGWSETGSDSGGQGWYDLVVAVSPIDEDEIYVGGVNTWKSTDGGVNWTLNSHWYQIPGVPAMHADKHALEWQNSTTLFCGNDGGIYKTTNGGTAWTDLTNGMVISQLYKIGVAQTDSKLIGGLQDNGTKVRSTAGVWSDHIGGDGMECAIDKTNSAVMYATLYYGELFRTTNGGTSWTDIQDNIPGNPSGAWVTPFILAPSNNSIIYAGYQDVYKSTNKGTSWTQISSGLTGGSDLRTLAAAPSDANVLYAATHDNLWRTTNGGTTWTAMTMPGWGTVSLAVNAVNADIIYATRSNYDAGLKVYKSINGGATWTNISGSLPNLPVNCIVYQTGSNDALYVGNDIGVYYRDNATGDWAAFDTGLPNVEVNELDIYYAGNKIRAATYGRGVWESDLNTANPIVLSPTAQNVSEVAGNTTINITSTVNWNASDNATWLTVAPTSGSNNGLLTCTFTANTSANPRIATVTVTDGTNTVTATIEQAGAPSTICSNGSEPVNDNITSPPAATLSKEYLSQIGIGTDIDHYKIVVTGTIPVPIRLYLSSLPGDYDLFLLNNVGTQLAVSDNGNTNNESILYTATPGTYYAKIIGFQGAFSTSDCYTFSVEKQTRALSAYPTTWNAYALASKARFEIVTNVSWTASSNVAWCTLPTTSGNGSADLIANFTANTGAARTATITITGGGLTETVKVVQAATSVCTDGNEPSNNVYTGAPTITANKEKYSQIGDTSDVDVWKFQLSATASTPAQIFLTNLPGDYDVFLLDAGGNVIASSENGGNSDEILTALIAPGYHYVKVIGYDNAFSNSQCYILTVRKSTKVLKAFPTLNTVNFLPGEVGFSVLSNVDWTVTPTDTWLTATNPTGSHDGTAYLQFTQNTGTTFRNGEAVLSGAGTNVTLKIKQLDDPNSFTNDDLDDRNQTENQEEEPINLADFPFILYPNPSTGETFFETDRDGESIVFVFDAFGRQILRATGENQIALDLSRQPAGIYRVRVENGGEVMFSNLVLVK